MRYQYLLAGGDADEWPSEPAYEDYSPEDGQDDEAFLESLEHEMRNHPMVTRIGYEEES